MTAKKSRPAFGTPVIDGMSLRDIAAALGMSTSRLCDWKRLAEVPENQFEGCVAAGHRTARTIIENAAGAPVPVRGRVERAQGLYRSMSPAERIRFLEWIRDQ